MNKEEIISSGLLEMYALGDTTPEENAQVLACCVQYPEVAEELMKVQMALEAYAMANAIEPNSGTKEKIFSTLNLETAKLEKVQAKVVSISPLRNIAAAAVLLLLGSAIFNVIFYNKYKQAYSKAEQTQQQLAALNENFSETANNLNAITDKHSLQLRLKPVVAPKDVDAEIYWITDTGEVYIDPSDLPAAPKGMQYQLWAIVDGKAMDAGLIVSKDGRTLKMQKMKTFGRAQAFAVTLEKEGGVVASKEKPFVLVSL